MYGIKFPRWSEDVRSEKRTLMHLPATAHRMDQLLVGAIFEIIAKEWPRLGRKYARVTHRSVVNFDDWTHLDVQKLNLITTTAVDDADRWKTYRQRWEAVHGDASINVTGPCGLVVVRIEFEYVAQPPMPEECIAA